MEDCACLQQNQDGEKLEGASRTAQSVGDSDGYREGINNDLRRFQSREI